MTSKKLFHKKVKFWRNHLKISPKWDIFFYLHQNSNEMPEDSQDVEACIDVDMAYFNATIDFNGPLINDKNVDNVIVHELLHIIVEPLDHFALLATPEKYHDQIRIFAESMIENLIPGVMAGVKH
jgi:predicted metal-dependent peptidase